LCITTHSPQIAPPHGFHCPKPGVLESGIRDDDGTAIHRQHRLQVFQEELMGFVGVVELLRENLFINGDCTPL